LIGQPLPQQPHDRLAVHRDEVGHCTLGEGRLFKHRVAPRLGVRTERRRGVDRGLRPWRRHPEAARRRDVDDDDLEFMVISIGIVEIDVSV